MEYQCSFSLKKVNTFLLDGVPQNSMGCFKIYVKIFLISSSKKKFKCYLICTDKTNTKCRQDFNDYRAAVTTDRVEGSNQGHSGLPQNMLSHQGPKVGHNKCILFSLRTKSDQTMKKTKTPPQCSISLLKHTFIMQLDMYLVTNSHQNLPDFVHRHDCR